VFCRAQWFFSDSTGVEQFVEEFAKKNKDVFDLEVEEHKLEYTAIHKDFQDQFEKKIEVRLSHKSPERPGLVLALVYVAPKKHSVAHTQFRRPF
jgi:hypothetical protein